MAELGNTFLEQITGLWLRQVPHCKKVKSRQFDSSAQTLWRFFKRRPYNERLLGDERYLDEITRQPHDPGELHVKPCLPKTREFVNVILPYAFRSDQRRALRPRRQPLPDHLRALAPQSGPSVEDQMRAWLLEYVLNYLVEEAYDLNTELRMALPEMLVKGRAVVWHDLVRGPTGPMPASLYESVDGLLIDGDCLQYRDAGYIVRRRRQSVWRLAERFRGEVDVEQLRAAAKDRGGRSEFLRALDGDGEQDDQADQITYYEVYSRMGLGQYLPGATAMDDQMGKRLVRASEGVGDHVWLVLVPGINHPINLPPKALPGMSDDELTLRLSWPVAFFDEPSNPWPLSFGDIYPNSDDPWATSPVEPALPLQVFLDRAYAYAMDRLKQNCHDVRFVAEEVYEEVMAALRNPENGLTVPFKGQPKKLEELMWIFEAPTINQEWWQTVGAVERQYEEATGMSPLMTTGQLGQGMRSATEAQARNERASSRPNDYRDAVRRFERSIASKEGQACRLYMTPQGVAPLFGEPAPSLDNDRDLAVSLAVSPLSTYWAVLVNTDSPAEAAAEVAYDLETGAGYLHDQSRRNENAQLVLNNFIPALLPMAQQGYAEPYNAALGLLAEWTETPAMRDLQIDPARLLPPPGEPGAEGQAAMLPPA
jgi:hypothetical protein